MTRPLTQFRHGYVLIVTLGLLVLATTVLVSVSNAALRRVQLAQQTGSDLQHRYGAASIRAAVLGRAESVLAIAEARQGTALISIRERVKLGADSFEIIVSDEQAKANINRMLLDSDETSVEARLREALAGTGVGRAVQIRSRREAAGTQGPVRLIGGLGQVFDLLRVSPEQLLNRARGALAPLDLLTIWGNGALNIRRASRSAASLALQPPLSGVEVGRLFDAHLGPRSSKGGMILNPLQRLFQDADVPASIAGRTVPVVMASACHSVWVITDDGNRRRYEVEILDNSDQNRPQRRFFSW